MTVTDGSLLLFCGRTDTGRCRGGIPELVDKSVAVSPTFNNQRLMQSLLSIGVLSDSDL